MDIPTSHEIAPPIEVKKLHFLIHPGYSIDPNVSNSVRDYDEPIYVDNDKRFEEDKYIFERYLDRATQLSDDELMIVFLHRSFPNFLLDFRENKEYTKQLSKLKEILGKRMIVTTHESHEESLNQRLKKIAHYRGFNLSESVSSEAIGEFVDACVPVVAQDANIAFGLTNKTMINPTYSSEFEDPPSEKNLRRLEDDYDRIHYMMGSGPRVEI